MATVAEQVWAAVCAERSGIVERMVRLASADMSAWPRGPLDLGPVPRAPGPDSAERFVDALGQWLAGGPVDAIAEWARADGPEGALAFVAAAREAVLSAAEGVGAAQWASERLDAVTSLVSGRLDELAAREREGLRVMVEQLEGAHGLASPLNVVSLHTEVALMKLEAGSPDQAAGSLREVLIATDRLIDARRALAERTPEWCHSLHRSTRALGSA